MSALRAARPRSETFQHLGARLLSQSAPRRSGQQVSPHIRFYKTFGRPVAKVLLMATFTYQLAYWAWVKLEKDEIKRERTDEIASLEAKLQSVIPDKKSS